MSQAPKVYCYNCRNYIHPVSGGYYDCSAVKDYRDEPGTYLHPPSKSPIYRDPKVDNAGNDCPAYKGETPTSRLARLWRAITWVDARGMI